MCFSLAETEIASTKAHTEKKICEVSLASAKINWLQEINETLAEETKSVLKILAGTKSDLLFSSFDLDFS